AGAAHGVVALAAGDLREGGARTGRQGREEGGGDDRGTVHGGLQRADEEVLPADRLDAAGRGHGDGAVGEGEDRGHLARGVGVRDGADGGAPVADRRVGDVRRRPGQQRLDPGGGVVV